jgi:hypothetical protein
MMAQAPKRARKSPAGASKRRPGHSVPLMTLSAPVAAPAVPTPPSAATSRLWLYATEWENFQ